MNTEEQDRERLIDAYMRATEELPESCTEDEREARRAEHLQLYRQLLLYVAQPKGPLQ